VVPSCGWRIASRRSSPYLGRHVQRDSVSRAERAILSSIAFIGAAGHRISTAHVESVMNHLVNRRLSKRQQMRWSPAGAHYLLQVRAELLNGTLFDDYRTEHPRFRGQSEFVQAVH
jgi:hypothetical protein